MKVYTKTGDTGSTALYGGSRVPKHHLRIEAYGTIDELNSHIGLLRDQQIDSHTQKILLDIQHKLFTLGAMLATPPEKEVLKNGKERLNISKVDAAAIAVLETEIDKMDASLPAMTHFVLPGGHQTVSFCHIARCVCRRAERLIAALDDVSPLNTAILTYTNRLSDYLFVLARKLTQDLAAKETLWIPEKNV